MRLIDAHALIDEINDMWQNHKVYLNNEPVVHFGAVIDLIGAASVIEAKPVVHAHWEWTGVLEEKMFICSHCRECAHYDGTTWWTDPFCWNCGAQMDELVSKTDELNSSVKIPVISMEDVPKIAKEMEK